MFFGQLLFVLFLVLANGFFVAAEFALVKVRVSQIELLADQGKWTARLAKSVLSHLDGYLSACQLGITLASLGLGWVGEPIVAEMLYPVLHLFGLPEETAHYIGLPIAFATITFLHITLGEQAPKILAIQTARATSLAVSPPLVVFYYVLRPVIWVLNTSSNLMLRAIGFGVVSEHEQVHSEEELKLILAESSAGGSLSLGEHRIMENVLTLEDKVARQVMLPRNDIIFLNKNLSVEENYKTVAESGHTRFPLCDGDLDHAIGMIHAKRLLQALISKRELSSLQELSQQVAFFPETIRLDALLQHFLRDRRHMALLVDEYGVISGMVTFEDVLEQLVGPIQDEFDREQPPIQKQPDGSFLVDAMCTPEELARRCALVLPEGSADTVGGMVIEQLGRIPKPGESIRGIGHELKVVDSNTRRVRRLRLTLLPDEASESAAEAAATQTPDGEHPSVMPQPAEKPTGEGAG